MRTKVLERVLKIDIADGDDDSVAVVAPVEAALLQPLEVRRVPDLFAHQVLCKAFPTHNQKKVSKNTGLFWHLQKECPTPGRT